MVFFLLRIVGRFVHVGNIYIHTVWPFVDVSISNTHTLWKFAVCRWMHTVQIC